MRLVFVNRFFHPDHSATSQILSDLCLALAARGHQVHVVTSRLRYDDPALALPANETASGVAVHRVWTTRFGRGTLAGRAMDYLTFYLSALWRLARLADRQTVLVAKTDPPMISVAAALAARATGAHLVNWTQDLFPEVAVAAGLRAMRPAPARWLAAVRDWSHARAALNVAIGERMREKMLGRGLADSKLAVIHNWADGEAIVPQARARGGTGATLPGDGRHSPADDRMDVNALRREWGLEGKFVVGYSGNLGRVHEFATVLEAAVQSAEREDVVFLFIGGGHQFGPLKAEARRRGLRNVQFRPYQPRGRLSQSLGACDAHLVTLRPEFEGLVLPSKFYGILAAGRPVLFVGAADGEIAGLVSEGRCGQAFAVGDARSLAQCLRGLADAPARTREWGENARRLFDARFAMPIAVDRWERVLAGVAQG